MRNVHRIAALASGLMLVPVSLYVVLFVIPNGISLLIDGDYRFSYGALYGIPYVLCMFVFAFAWSWITLRAIPEVPRGLVWWCVAGLAVGFFSLLILDGPRPTPFPAAFFALIAGLAVATAIELKSKRDAARASPAFIALAAFVPGIFIGVFWQGYTPTETVVLNVRDDGSNEWTANTKMRVRSGDRVMVTAYGWLNIEKPTDPRRRHAVPSGGPDGVGRLYMRFGDEDYFSGLNKSVAQPGRPPWKDVFGGLDEWSGDVSAPGTIKFHIFADKQYKMSGRYIASVKVIPRSWSF
jgi:hypothetical protein